MAESTLTERLAPIAAEASARAAEIDAARVVPSEIVSALADAGAFRMYVPRSLGGLELDPISVIETVELMANADGSAGWTTFVLNTTTFACWLDPAVAKEILSNPPDAGMAGAFSPIGKAVPDGDGFRLDGRWPFNSGAPHAAWFMEGGYVVDDAGEPRLLPDGRPDWRFFFMPASDMEILDTWHVAGLRGTASHDVTTTGTHVPAERTVNPIFSTAPHDAPYFRWPFFSLVGTLLVGVPLGVARRALDEFEVLATTKSRRSPVPLAETEVVSHAIVRVEGLLRAARALMIDTVGEAWDRSLAGDDLEGPHRVALRVAGFNAMRAAIDVVDTVFELAGGGAIYDKSPLQRCWRDIHAARNHIFYCNNDMASTGRALMSGDFTDYLV